MSSFAGVAAAVMVTAVLAMPDSSGAAVERTVEVYDDFDAPGYSLDDYGQKWSNPYGLLEMDSSVRPDTRTFDGGRFNIEAVPFKVGADFGVFDHLKYLALSNRSFSVPERGSVTFASTIAARTPGTIEGLTVDGLFSGDLSPFSHVVREGQQAGVVMNMIDFCTGQRFDWFVSGTKAFSLIERLPTAVTGNTSNPDCPDATYVGRESMYTQIVEEHAIEPGETQRVAIRYSTDHGEGMVEFFLNGRRTARIRHVGVPLDVQGVDYSGYAPSLGPGEELGDEIRGFAIGHGLFSLLDAFPYQHPDVPELAVSIPMEERLFGQGAAGSWDDFTVRSVQHDTKSTR